MNNNKHKQWNFMFHSSRFVDTQFAFTSMTKFFKSECIFFHCCFFLQFSIFFPFCIFFQFWIDKLEFASCSSTASLVFPVTGFTPHHEFVPLKHVFLLWFVCFCLISDFHVVGALFFSIEKHRFVFFIKLSFCKWHE